MAERTQSGAMSTIKIGKDGDLDQLDSSGGGKDKRTNQQDLRFALQRDLHLTDPALPLPLPSE